MYNLTVKNLGGIFYLENEKIKRYIQIFHYQIINLFFTRPFLDIWDWPLKEAYFLLKIFHCETRLIWKKINPLLNRYKFVRWVVSVILPCLILSNLVRFGFGFTGLFSTEKNVYAIKI